MSGSTADTGLDYQAQATAYVAVFVLTGQPLGWFDDLSDIPIAVAAESGGVGDDIRITLNDGTIIETQAKHGLDKDSRFWSAIERLSKGLVAEHGLRTTLLVDNTSSRTISPALRDDLLRGDRTDQQKSITAEVRAFLQKLDIDAEIVFPRLRIIQKDFDIGSDGVAAAHALLRQVLASPSDVATAWRILVDEGHKLIKHRGRRDTASFSRLLARHFALAQQSTAPAIIAQNYCAWLVEKTATYYVPGLGVSLPIDSAWIQLRVLEDRQDRRPVKASLKKIVQDYHEWERLADDFSHHDKINVEQLPEFANRCLILGGPGSGKSTLARRLAHQFGKQGRVAFVVRLKLLVKLLERGKSFDEAMLLATTDGLGMPIEILQRALVLPDCLVADGLDECDPQRAEVAERLKAWCDGHATCRVIVTTRPIGHDPGLLPGFEHYELLPLDTSSIREHSRRLIEHYTSDESLSAELWSRFIDSINDETKEFGKRVSTLAARNPLLLGFLVRLHIDGLDSTRNRAELFVQILQLMEKVTDPAQQPRQDIISQIANTCLDKIGWQIIQSPMINVDDLLTLLRSDLVNKCRPSEESELVLAAFRFWEASRVIERLSAGHLEAVVFVHPVLGEFAAARHVLGLTLPDFEDWLSKVRRQPRWYQTILLAAGIDQQDRVIKSLLAFDDPSEPCSTEAKTAASALVDGACVSEETRQKIVKTLISRLTSPIPLVSIESAISLLPIARFAADMIVNATAELRHDEQEWTRLASLSLSTACGKCDLDYFEEWFRTFELGGILTIGEVSPFARFCRGMSAVMPEETTELYHQLVEIGVQRMIVERPQAHVEEFFDELKHTDGLSMRMIRYIENVLQKGGFEKQAEAISDRHWKTGKEHAEWIRNASKRENEVLLNCVLTACGMVEPVTLETNIERFPLICAVIQTMRFGESYARNLVYIRKAIDCEAISEAMKGVIASLGFDVSEVVAEAVSALRRNEEDFGLSFLLPRTPSKPEWNRAAYIGLIPDLLKRAIQHPHPSIAYASTMLVDAGAAGTETEQLVLDLLKDGTSQTLQFAAHLVRSVLGERSGQIIWNRLRAGISAGCEHLIKLLIRHASSESRSELLVDIGIWMLHPGPRFAAKMVESLDELSPSIDVAFIPQLRQAMEYWTVQRTWCDEHQMQTDSDSCPVCNIVLPSVKAAVLKQLIKLKAVPVEELIGLLADKHSEVKKAATSALMVVAEENPEIVGKLLDMIDGEQLSLSLLDQLSSLPAQILRENEQRFTRLLSSTNHSIRHAALKFITGHWIPRDKAKVHAREALCDVDPAVRTQAVHVLRSIEHADL